jgi:hypothetical protein
MAQGMKKLAEEYDFIAINRRIKEFDNIMKVPEKQAEFIKRFNALYSYIHAPSGKQEQTIRQSDIKRSLFFHYWKRLCKYGLLGLADSGRELFRQGKVGMDNEARLVISKLQKPDRQNIDFVKVLETKKIKVCSSLISMIFKRWKAKAFRSEFVDNLKRLETDFQTEEKNEDRCLPEINPVRLVDRFYLPTLQGLAEHGMPTDSPGLFILWAYLEKLGIFPILSGMRLTALPGGQKKGYSWFDLFLLNVARIFYGISNYTAVSEQPDPTLPFFAGLVKAPCNDTFLNGLESRITEKETFNLRQWLIKKAYELGLVKLRKTALDFHQIDMDVIFDNYLTGIDDQNPFSKNIEPTCFPNPASGICTIAYTIPQEYEGDVSISLLDSKMSTVKILSEGYAKKGTNKHSFNSNDFSPGLYFYQIELSGRKLVGKLMIL